MSSSESAVPIVFEPEPETREPRFVPDPPPAPLAEFRPEGASARRAQAPEPAPEPVDLAAIEQRGFERGVASGRAELPWQEAARLESAARALEEAARELGELRRDYLAANRRVVVDLALAVAERLARRSLAGNADALGDALAAALEPLADAPELLVSLAPADLETLEAGAEGALATLAAGRPLQTRADASLRPGDVRVDGGPAQVDGRLATMLEHVRDALEDALGVPEEAAS